jgi:ribosomal protein S18 acetylase RimI-like enzyme
MPAVVIKVVERLEDYPPGLIGAVTALFGRCIAASHGVDWTLDVMIAEEQCRFFRSFDSGRDRVWVAMDGDLPRGALTIEGPRPGTGKSAARLRFFILDPDLRGRGLGRTMLRKAMQYCGAAGYRTVYLTTLADLDSALHLYQQEGFVVTSQSEEAFHGSRYVEQTLEWRADGSAPLAHPGCP